jgi:glucose 1-dehydrogenase
MIEVMEDQTMKGLQGKNVLVTGSTSGIGQAIAVRLAQEGANVAINYRSRREEAAATHAQVHGDTLGEHMHDYLDEMEETGVNHIFVQGDVSVEADVVRMVQETIDKLGGLDILINNAGIQIPGDSHELTMEAFDRVLAVNLRGAYMCAREAIKHFLAQEKPGVIINVSRGVNCKRW